MKYILVNVTEWFLLFKPNSKPSQEIPGFIFDVNNYFKQKLTCSDLKSNRFAKVELLECGLICLFFVTVGICTVPLLTDKRTDVWSRNFLIWEINFRLWAVAWAGPWEKGVWADSEQLFWVVFSIFHGQKKKKKLKTL